MHWLPLVAMVIASALPFPHSPVPRLVTAATETGGSLDSHGNGIGDHGHSDSIISGSSGHSNTSTSSRADSMVKSEALVDYSSQSNNIYGSPQEDYRSEVTEKTHQSNTAEDFQPRSLDSYMDYRMTTPANHIEHKSQDIQKHMTHLAKSDLCNNTQNTSTEDTRPNLEEYSPLGNNREVKDISLDYHPAEDYKSQKRVSSENNNFVDMTRKENHYPFNTRKEKTRKVTDIAIRLNYNDWDGTEKKQLSLVTTVQGEPLNYPELQKEAETEGKERLKVDLEVGRGGSRVELEVGREGLKADLEVEGEGSSVELEVGREGSRVELEVGGEGSSVELEVGREGSRVELEVGREGSKVELEVGREGSRAGLEVGREGSRVELEVGREGSRVELEVGREGSRMELEVGREGSRVELEVGREGSKADLEVGREGSRAGLEVGREGSRVELEVGREGLRVELEVGREGSKADLEVGREGSRAGLEVGREGSRVELEVGREGSRAGLEVGRGGGRVELEVGGEGSRVELEVGRGMLLEDSELLFLDAHPRVLFTPSSSPPKHPPLLLLLEAELPAVGGENGALQEEEEEQEVEVEEGEQDEGVEKELAGALARRDEVETAHPKSRPKRASSAYDRRGERSVCEVANEWVTDKKTAIDILGNTVTVLPEIQTPRGPLKQYFFETKCRLPDARGTGGSGVSGRDCVGVDKKHWVSECKAKQSYVRALTTHPQRGVGWRWIRIDSSCVCVLQARVTRT